MLLAVGLVLLLVLSGAGMAASTRRRFEVCAGMVGVSVASLTTLTGNGGFVAACAAAIAVLGLLTAKTISETLDEIAAMHRVECPRRRR